MHQSLQPRGASAASDYNAGHPTAQGIADDIRFLPSSIAVDPPTSENPYKLSASDVEFFKSHGYLIKRGLLASQTEAIDQANRHFWASVPQLGIRKNDPNTWHDNPTAHWREEDHVRVGSLVGTNWKMRSRGYRGIGTEAFLVDGLANHPRMLSMASAFLGAVIRPVQRVRGIYGVFPIAGEEPGRLYPHGDYMASQLSAMVLLTDVAPNGGGFTVWPGSHKRMHMSWDGVSGSTISGNRVQAYPRERDAVLREINPVEFTGSAGDVIWWHPRIIHSAGANLSLRTNTPTVRLLTPIDYQRAGETYIDDLEYGPGPRYQWWVDTRNTREDVAASPDNLWHGWGFN